MLWTSFQIRCNIISRIYIKRNHSPGFYCDLVYKLRRVKGAANFISSGSKNVKRLRRRQYDPLIIERTIGLVISPLTVLYGSFLKRCTLTNKADGTIWRPCPNLLRGDRVLILVPSDCYPGNTYFRNILNWLIWDFSMTFQKKGIYSMLYNILFIFLNGLMKIFFR